MTSRTATTIALREAAWLYNRPGRIVAGPIQSLFQTLNPSGISHSPALYTNSECTYLERPSPDFREEGSLIGVNRRQEFMTTPKTRAFDEVLHISTSLAAHYREVYLLERYWELSLRDNGCAFPSASKRYLLFSFRGLQLDLRYVYL